MEKTLKNYVLALLGAKTFETIHSEPKKINPNVIRVCERHIADTLLTCDVDLDSRSIIRSFGDVEFSRFTAKTDDEFVDKIKKLPINRVMSLSETDLDRIKYSNKEYVTEEAKTKIAALYNKEFGCAPEYDQDDNVKILCRDVEFYEYGLEANVKVIASIPGRTISKYIDGQLKEQQTLPAQEFVEFLGRLSEDSTQLDSLAELSIEEYLQDNPLELSCLVISESRFAGYLSTIGIDGFKGPAKGVMFRDNKTLNRISIKVVCEKLLEMPELKALGCGHVLDIETTQTRTVRILFKKD